MRADTVTIQTKQMSGRGQARLVVVLALAVALASACAAREAGRRSGSDALGPEQMIRMKIAEDPRLDGQRITVGFQEGVATLSGEVESVGQKLVAEEDLYEITGVREVSNNLEVKAVGLTDEEIARRIRASVPGPGFGGAAGAVDVKAGHVILSGESVRPQDQQVLLNVALFTPGVRSVDNRVAGLPCVKGTESLDSLIRQHVQAVLRSLPVDVREVKVEVNEGRVTLRGYLDSGSEEAHMLRAVRDVPGVVAVEDRTSSSSEYERRRYFPFGYPSTFPG